MKSLAIISPQEYKQLKEITNDLISAKAFPATNAEQAFAVVWYGREIGVSEMVALQNISIVHGRVYVGGKLTLARYQAHGGRFKVLSHTRNECEIEWTYKGGSIATRVDREELSNVKTKENDRWIPITETVRYRNYPEQMIYWRNVTKGVNMIAPCVLMGAGIREAESDFVEHEFHSDSGDAMVPVDCEIVDEPEPSPAPAAEPEPAPAPAPAEPATKKAPADKEHKLLYKPGRLKKEWKTDMVIASEIIRNINILIGEYSVGRSVVNKGLAEYGVTCETLHEISEEHSHLLLARIKEKVKALEDDSKGMPVDKSKAAEISPEELTEPLAVESFSDIDADLGARVLAAANYYIDFKDRNYLNERLKKFKLDISTFPSISKAQAEEMVKRTERVKTLDGDPVADGAVRETAIAAAKRSLREYSAHVSPNAKEGSTEDVIHQAMFVLKVTGREFSSIDEIGSLGLDDLGLISSRAVAEISSAKADPPPAVPEEEEKPKSKIL